MDPKDLEIEQRLAKLRNLHSSKSTITDAAKLDHIKNSFTTHSNVSNEDIVARLANLKDGNTIPTDGELKERLVKIQSGLNDSNVPMLSNEDIIARLENLKDKNAIPTDKELEERLANIQGRSKVELDSNIPDKNCANILINKKKSDTEQVNDLLKSLMTEIDIDTCVTSNSRSVPENRGLLTTFSKNVPSSSSSIKTSTLAYVDKIVAEYKLPIYDNDSSSSEKDKDDSEDDWCAICNEDATLRCSGCSGDLYCRDCYNEFHTPSDTEDDHTSQPFVKKKKTRETAL